MARAEAEGRSTRVDVRPVVVGVGDAQVAGVFFFVAVAVPDEGGLPVVVDVAVADGDIVGSVGELGVGLV